MNEKEHENEKMNKTVDLSLEFFTTNEIYNAYALMGMMHTICNILTSGELKGDDAFFHEFIGRMTAYYYELKRIKDETNERAAKIP